MGDALPRKDHVPADFVLIAEIGAPHGVQGEVRIKLFSDSVDAFSAYGPLLDADGHPYAVKNARASKSVYVCRIDGFSTRDAVEKLNRKRLYIPRESLPDPDEDEFYHVDLIGLEARLQNGERVGRIQAVHDFGAGDILEIRPSDGPLLMVSFTRAMVPQVDIEAGFVSISPSALMTEGDTQPSKDNRDD